MINGFQRYKSCFWHYKFLKFYLFLIAVELEIFHYKKLAWN